MGIRLVFVINRETFKLEIIGREIFYYDRKWEKQIRVIPRDEHFIKKILLSRNKYPNYLLDLFNLTADEQMEYNLATTEEDLAKIVIEDCRKKGAVLQKREVI